MAKRAKKTEGDGHGVSALRGNGFDKAAATAFVHRVENVHAEIATEKSKFMTRCKELHSDVTAILDEAKGAGIPKKAIRNVVKKHALEAKLEDIRDSLDGDDLDSYDQLLQALGELGGTPLGQAAVARGEQRAAA